MTNYIRNIGIGVGVVGLAALAGWGIYQASQMAQVSREMIPPSSERVRQQCQLSPHLFPLPASLSFMKAPFTDKAFCYFEGSLVCLSIDPSNVRSFLNVVEFLEEEGAEIDAKGLREQCREVLEKGKTIQLDSRDCQTPQKLSPYVKGQQKKNAGPASFYESRMQRPGIVLINEGDEGYVIQNDQIRTNHPKNSSTVRWISEQVYEDPNHRRAIEVARESDAHADKLDKGFGFNVDGKKVVLAMNPTKLSNYKKAKKYLHGKIRKFKDMTDDSIIKVLTTTHSKLLKDVDEANAGKIRDQYMIVYKQMEAGGGSLQGIIGRKGGKQKEEIVANLVKRAQKEGKDPLEIATDAENQILRLVAYLPPKPAELPAKVKELASYLREITQKMECPDFDPVAAAASIHMTMVNLHLFGDANGRMARLVMNGILRAGGYQAAIFPSDEEYTAAVEADAEKPGHFAEFLYKQIGLAEREFGPNLPCVPGLSCDD